MAGALLLLLAALALVTATPAASLGMFDPRLVIANMSYRGCGNYCGPGWANGTFISEHEAYLQHQLGKPLVEPMNSSCADTCCQSHDMCCGSGNETLRRSCNREMLGCLQSCGNDETCLDENQTPFLFDSLVAALESVQGQCCGVMCDPAHDVTTNDSKFVDIAYRVAAGEVARAEGVASKVWWQKHRRRAEQMRQYEQLAAGHATHSIAAQSSHGNTSWAAGYAAGRKAAESRRLNALHPQPFGT